MQTSRYRTLPAVHQVLQWKALDVLLAEYARRDVVVAVQDALDTVRSAIRAGAPYDASEGALLALVTGLLQERTTPRLRPVINATGVVLHTNLGRAPLAQEAVQAIADVAAGYSTLEFNLATGERGHRDTLVEPLLQELTGAQAALVVNNNAAAVFLALTALAKGKKVAISRGELVEIGGSFRVSDVMRESGAVLVEVGTTNKTHLRDFEEALAQGAELVLRVHTSNFRVVGFTERPSLSDLTALAHRYSVPLLEDIGSGSLVDLRSRSVGDEPTIAESVRAGVDLVMFSGDKLLGGAQAGIVCGRQDLVEQLRRHQLARAVRVDKLTLAGLEATLRLYRDEKRAYERIPTLRMLTASQAVLAEEAATLAETLRLALPAHVRIRTLSIDSQVGGGALPLTELPGAGIGITVDGVGAATTLAALREAPVPIVARIVKEEVILDVRTIFVWQHETFVTGIVHVITALGATDSLDDAHR